MMLPSLCALAVAVTAAAVPSIAAAGGTTTQNGAWSQPVDGIRARWVETAGAGLMFRPLTFTNFPGPAEHNGYSLSARLTPTTARVAIPAGARVDRPDRRAGGAAAMMCTR